MASVGVVIPAYNEVGAIADTIRRIRAAFAASPHTVEIVVVDDGSVDGTGHAAQATGARVVRHPVNSGYGNALLSGTSVVGAPFLAITDADGTYPVEELPGMVSETVERELDMLVGARTGKQYLGGLTRRLARLAFKMLAEFACGRRIPDINSGMRVMRRDMVWQYRDVLSGGFSFTTTLTIIAMLTGRFVDYRPIAYAPRIGTSHVSYRRDILRAAQILVMTVVIFNPIKFFLLYALMVLALGAMALLLQALVPASLQGHVLLGSLFVLTAVLLMGLGFLAEQRRASPFGITPFSRHGPGRGEDQPSR